MTKIKTASIGEFAELKPEEEREEKVKEETKQEEAPKQEQEAPKTSPELTPEQLKEKILSLVSEVSSRGLTEEEKKKFIEDFKFWNGTMFELLEIGNHLQALVGKTSIKLSPTHALLLYAGATVGCVVLLRKDFQDKIFKSKPNPEEQKYVEEKVEENVEEKQKL